jgi:3-deoxy-D-manno-octulosonic-acid transferase
VIILIYRLFLWLYKTGAILISPWNPKARQWIAGRKNLLLKISESLNTTSTANRVLWMHCASLGEFEQGRPVLEKIKQDYPSTTIILTFFSPSGHQQVINNYEHFAHFVFYLPADSAANAKKLLDIVQPNLVLWVKYEYWHFYLREIKQRAIPLLLVSGIFRDDQPFFKWYGGFYKNILTNFTHFFVQNERSKQLLGSIGYSNNVTIGGDTRFDRVITIAENFSSIDKIELFINDNHTSSTAPVIVAGSTWEEDEEELVHFVKNHPEIKFIIAPHDIQESRLQEVEELFSNHIRFSNLNKGVLFADNDNKKTVETAYKHCNLLIIDNIGMLSQLYKYATIAYIGGGFGNDGVHNVLEAAVYGKPVVFGPEHEKYMEAVELINNGGGFYADSALELEAVFNKLLDNKEAYDLACKAAKNYVAVNKGATSAIMEFIQEKRLLTK